MPAAGITVLVVDDQFTMRKILREILRKIGITQVEEAESANKALHRLLADDIRPDLIISDLYMEGGGGIDLLRRIKLEPTLRDMNVPVILLTGETSFSVLEQARQEGICCVLTKPCSSQAIANAISKAVGFSIM
ncbi:MAG: response regulator [Bdellovibrionales bacterium]